MAWIVTPLVIVLFGTRWRQERYSDKAQNKELKKNFSELDLNGDGMITLTELKTGIEKQGRKFQKVSRLSKYDFGVTRSIIIIKGLERQEALVNQAKVL